MIKQHSWTRRDYEAVYMLLRRGETTEWLQAGDEYSQYAIKAADYSYQAFGCEPHGWSSHRRYRAFLHIKWRILSREEQIN